MVSSEALGAEALESCRASLETEVRESTNRRHCGSILKTRDGLRKQDSQHTFIYLASGVAHRHCGSSSHRKESGTIEQKIIIMMWRSNNDLASAR